MYIGASRAALAFLIAAFLFPAIWSSTQTARLLNRKDPGSVVIDEVLGQWVTLLGATALYWKTLLAGFVLFRIFDIWKPWPVGQFEKLPEGSGIVADDLAAGVYGALILYISGRFGLY
jgi:phosphatidylglycerophosphatase A